MRLVDADVGDAELRRLYDVWNLAMAPAEGREIAAVDRNMRILKLMRSFLASLPTVAAPENKPLTLEQLESTIENHPKDWLWLEDLTGSENSLYQRNDRTYHWSNITNYGKTWLAYARKPEGSET